MLCFFFREKGQHSKAIWVENKKREVGKLPVCQKLPQRESGDPLQSKVN